MFRVAAIAFLWCLVGTLSFVPAIVFFAASNGHLVCYGCSAGQKVQGLSASGNQGDRQPQDHPSAVQFPGHENHSGGYRMLLVSLLPRVHLVHQFPSDCCRVVS